MLSELILVLRPDRHADLDLARPVPFVPTVIDRHCSRDRSEKEETIFLLSCSCCKYINVTYLDPLCLCFY